jgi:hypothetical protein
MKKIFTAAILFINCVAFSQIKVIPTTPLEDIGKIGLKDIYIQKEGDEFTVFYKNIEIKDSDALRKFSFKNVDNDFDNLYAIIMDGFKQSPLYDIKLELPNDYVWLHYTRKADKLAVQLMSSNKATATTGISDFLSRDQIGKLFGKGEM